MPAEIAGEHDLRIGQMISSERQEEIGQQIAEESALGAALNLFSYRDRSESEMRRRLTEKGFGEAVVTQTIALLEEYNYLDDQAFANQLAEQQLMRGRGRRAAAHALSQAGLDPELVAQALSAVYQSETEIDAAVAWLERKPVPQNQAERQKLLRNLASRGFSFDVAQEALTRQQAGNEAAN